MTDNTDQIGRYERKAAYLIDPNDWEEVKYWAITFLEDIVGNDDEKVVKLIEELYDENVL